MLVKRIFLPKQKKFLWNIFLYYRVKLNCSKIKIVSTNFQTCLHSKGGSRKFRKSWCGAVGCHFYPSNDSVQVLFGKKVSKKASNLLSVPFELAFTSFKILFSPLTQESNFLKGSKIYPYHCKCSDPREGTSFFKCYPLQTIF